MDHVYWIPCKQPKKTILYGERIPSSLRLEGDASYPEGPWSFFISPDNLSLYMKKADTWYVRVGKRRYNVWKDGDV